jgi:hypothetical protein
MYFEIFGRVAIVEKVTSVSVDDELTVFNTERGGIFADFPVVEVLAIE